MSRAPDSPERLEPFPTSFFERDALEVARDLLGTLLLHVDGDDVAAAGPRGGVPAAPERSGGASSIRAAAAAPT